VKALVAKGHHVTCVVRPKRKASDLGALPVLEFTGAVARCADVTDPASLASDGFKNEAFDAVVSCLASRTGDPQDA
jgi:divinyl chlorophyllide a 8-vinyl-reductase